MRKTSVDEQDLIYRLRKRAEIRRAAKGRKSVEEGKPDRISDLLEEAATEISDLRLTLNQLNHDCKNTTDMVLMLTQQLRTYITSVNDE